MSDDSNMSFPQVAEINASLAENIIHYDLQRIDYAISSSEIEALENFETSIWKDVFFSTSTLAVATLINGVVLWLNLGKNAPLNLSIFLNLLIGGICFVLAVISLFVWRTSKNNFKALVANIKSKPAYKLPTN